MEHGNVPDEFNKTCLLLDMKKCYNFTSGVKFAFHPYESTYLYQVSLSALFSLKPSVKLNWTDEPTFEITDKTSIFQTIKHIQSSFVNNHK